jgi:hypothetical protein
VGAPHLDDLFDLEFSFDGIIPPAAQMIEEYPHRMDELYMGQPPEFPLYIDYIDGIARSRGPSPPPPQLL